MKNFSFLATAYKEFTEFGIQSESKKVKRIGIGRRMVNVFKTSIAQIFALDKEVTLSEAIDLLIEEIFKIVPFIGNLPFISTILSTILGKIAEYLIVIFRCRYFQDRRQMYFPKVVMYVREVDGTTIAYPKRLTLFTKLCWHL